MVIGSTVTGLLEPTVSTYIIKLKYVKLTDTTYYYLLNKNDTKIERTTIDTDVAREIPTIFIDDNSLQSFFNVVVVWVFISENISVFKCKQIQY